MAVPPEIMAQMQGQMPGAAPGGAPGGMPGAMPPDGGFPSMDQPSPAAAPMTAPSMPEGQRMAAMAQMGNVLDVMEQTLPKLGMDSPEGQAVMQAMQSLTAVFGNQRSKMKELQPAQIMQLMRALPTQMRGEPSGQ